MIHVPGDTRIRNIIYMLIIYKCKNLSIGTNRIYHWSPMQTEQSQPEDKRKMPKTRFNEFPTSRSSSEAEDQFYFIPVIRKVVDFMKISPLIPLFFFTF